jgi:hypothetical protein
LRYFYRRYATGLVVASPSHCERAGVLDLSSVRADRQRDGKSQTEAMTRTERTGAARRRGEVNRDHGVVAAVAGDRSSTPRERSPGGRHRDRGRPVGCKRSPRRLPDLMLRRGGDAVVEMCGVQDPPTQSGKSIRSDLIGARCAVCGSRLEPVGDLGKIVGCRVIETRASASPTRVAFGRADSPGVSRRSSLDVSSRAHKRGLAIETCDADPVSPQVQAVSARVAGAVEVAPTDRPGRRVRSVSHAPQ